jgi:hypothetical protein
MASTEPYVKKRSDAYTGILAISFLALVGATVFLYLEYQNYENKPLPKSPVIDVPGAKLATDPKSGGPPPPKQAPKTETPPDSPMPMPMPMDMPMPPMPMPKMMMRNETRPNDSRPALLPIEPTVAAPIVIPDPIIAPAIEQVQRVVPEKAEEPIIQIPDLPPPPAPIGDSKKPKFGEERNTKVVEPIIPISDPIEPEAPPLPPVKRFDPPR